jgi:hypothetical protein
MPQIYQLMAKLIAIKVSINITTRRPSIVTVGIFDSNGQQQMSFRFPGDLFPLDLQEGDELFFARTMQSTVLNDSNIFKSIM